MCVCVCVCVCVWYKKTKERNINSKINKTVVQLLLDCFINGIYFVYISDQNISVICIHWDTSYTSQNTWVRISGS